MTCLGVLDRGERDDGNETGLKDGGEIEMSTTVLPLRDARSLRLIYLPFVGNFFCFFSFLIFFNVLDVAIFTDLHRGIHFGTVAWQDVV